MLTICGKITKDQIYDCANPIFAGAEAMIYIFNRSELLPPVRNTTNPLIVSGLELVQGATGYRFQGKNRSTAPQVDLVRGDYSARFNHIVNFLVFNNTAATKQEIFNMAEGLFVVVVENKMKSGDSAFEIYGLEQGLQLAAQTLRNVNDAPTGGAWTLQLASVPDFEEPRPPASFFSEDYEATKAALEDLLTPEPTAT